MNIRDGRDPLTGRNQTDNASAGRESDWMDGLDVIDAYTRAEAIEDGVLVEVSPQEANAAGFGCPVALTREAWFSCVEREILHGGQHEEPEEAENRRLRDLLRAAALTVSSAPPDSFSLAFTARGIPPEPGSTPQEVRLIVCGGPGDAGEPVITVMLPGED